MPNLIPTTEVARILKLNRATVARLVDRGLLVPAVKGPGRTGAYLFNLDDVRAFAEKRAA